MYIKDYFTKDKTIISFEIFPPKKDTPVEGVLEASKLMADMKPSYMSITYGAGGTSRDNTVSLSSYVQNELGITALSHLTCVGTKKDELPKMLKELKENNVSNILALRGDFPEGGEQMPLHYKHASDLIEEIKKTGGFCVGGACYPEGHLESDNVYIDMENLKYKVDAGVDFLVSQLFFDNSVFFNFLYRAAAKGINVPIDAGIMPVTSKKQIKRMCALSGSALTPKYKSILDKYYDKPESLEKAGIAYATDQIIDLIANGVSGIHLYTMNKPEIAGAIMKNLEGII